MRVAIGQFISIPLGYKPPIFISLLYVLFEFVAGIYLWVQGSKLSHFLVVTCTIYWY